jgi:8-oxo-dGTP pyrophosphatase MutT (NUDIX family)
MIEIHYKKKPSPTTNQPWMPSVHGVVCNDKGAILLHAREDHASWALPGGKLESGESIMECLKREMLEETGLNVSPEKLLGVFSSPEYVLSVKGRVFQPLLIVFLCNVKTPELKVGPESLSFMWMDQNNIDTLNAFPLIKEIAQRVWAGAEDPFFDESSFTDKT